MIYSPYAALLYLFFFVPFICLAWVVLLGAAAFSDRPLQCLSITLSLVAVVAVSGVLLNNKDTTRAHLRWLLWSRYFKSEVLAQPASPEGKLRHMEWEATGFAGVANDTVYLVFDPSDSLSAARPPGNFNGIPCQVRLVRRLERYWYSVWFYTDEIWGKPKHSCSVYD